MKNKGFTLIELIVSVTIIAVLTVIGVVSYAGASQKARDGRRVADLEKIRIALEIYRQDFGFYPANLTSLTTKYMQEIPVGPKGETYNSGYTKTSDYIYSLGVIVESLGSTNMAATTCSSVVGCNYKVTNP